MSRWNSETRPRTYAADIIALKTREKRRQALARVPDNFREWVRKLLALHARHSRAEVGR